MGLDNYWCEQNSNEPVTATGCEELQICGGMFSGSGQDSFRGKVYAEMTEDITGISLYEKRIAHEVVSNMAKILEEHRWNQSLETTYGISKMEYDDYVAMFKAHAKEAHELTSWY